MRARLLDATVELLVEKGLRRYVDHAGQRAGRGQPGRAAAPLPDQARPRGGGGRARDRGARRRAARPRPELPTGPRRTRAVLQVLGDHFTSPVFTAALELWVAARTDPALLAEVGPLEQQVGRETHRMTVELLGADESQPGVRELVQATLDLVRGLGLANTISDDPAGATGSSTSGRDPRRPASAPRMTDLLPHSSTTSRPRATSSESPGRPARRRRLAHPDAGRRAGTSPPRSRTCAGPTRSRSCARADATRQAWDDVVLAAIDDPTGYVDAEALAAEAASPRRAAGPLGAGRSRAEASARRAARGPEDAVVRPADVAASMATARFMETWAHALDVHDAARVSGPSRPTGSGTSRTSASGPATSPSRCTRMSRRPRSSASSWPRPAATLDVGTGGRRADASPVRRTTSACWSPSGSTAPTPTWWRSATTPTTGSTSRRPSPARPETGTRPAR